VVIGRRSLIVASSSLVHISDDAWRQAELLVSAPPAGSHASRPSSPVRSGTVPGPAADNTFGPDGLTDGRRRTSRNNKAAMQERERASESAVATDRSLQGGRRSSRERLEYLGVCVARASPPPGVVNRRKLTALCQYISNDSLYARETSLRQLTWTMHPVQPLASGVNKDSTGPATTRTNT